MANQGISITQALAEIKLLNNRIQKIIDDDENKYVVMKTKRSLLDTEKFATQARASIQSFHDLLHRYNAIKAAIVASNAVTKVSIAGKTYTVAEAVERKRSIKMEKALLEKLKAQHLAIQQEFKRHNEFETMRVDRLIQSELSKDSRTNVDIIKSLTETFLEDNKAEIIDPLNLSAKIATMEKEIEDFETTVDWVLSESNGRSYITL
jgi:hypothetical protein